MTKFILRAWVIVALLPMAALSQEKAADGVSSKILDGIVHRYDASENRTSFWSIPSPVLFKPATDRSYSVCLEHAITLKAGFAFEGKIKAANPDFIELRLYSRKLYRSFFKKEKKRFLVFVADGEKLDAGLMMLAHSENKNINVTVTGGPIVSTSCPTRAESLTLQIPAEKFLKIAESKKIRLKIGGLSMRLTKRTREKLLRLAKKIRE